MIQNSSPLINTLLTLLDENHAIDTVVLDVQAHTTITSYMVICSGRSSRQVIAIAEHIMEKMKKHGYPAYGESGLKNGEWVLIDFGEAVLHVMQPEMRAFYHLEGLWQAPAEK